MKKVARKREGTKSAQVNDPDLKALVDYVCTVFSLPALTPLLQKQISDMHITYSYEDMLLAAHYFFEYDKGARQNIENASLGILPFVMEDARAFAQMVEKAKQTSLQPRDAVVVRVVRPNALVSTTMPMEAL